MRSQLVLGSTLPHANRRETWPEVQVHNLFIILVLGCKRRKDSGYMFTDAESFQLLQTHLNPHAAPRLANVVPVSEEAPKASNLARDVRVLVLNLMARL